LLKSGEQYSDFLLAADNVTPGGEG